MHLGFSLVTVRPGMVGGAESYALGLLSAYASGAGPERTTVLANAAGMRAYAGLAGPRLDVAFVPGLDPHGSSAKRAWQLGRAALMPWRLKADIPRHLDLVHYPVVVPLPRTSAPTVITLHDVRHLAMPGQFSRVERAYRRLAYDESARRADAVVTVSEYARATIIEMLGLPAERVVAIHHGIDHTRFKFRADINDAAVLERLDVRKPYVIYPANLWPHKNHRRLLEAMAELRDTGASLVLTGETYGRLPDLLAEAHGYGLSDVVRHLGFVSADSLPTLYRHATALVFPSLYEGFGAPPLEAMACGCPCVLPDQGAVREVTADIGEIIDPTDAGSIADGIRRLFEDEHRRNALIERGRSHSATFTWTSAAQKHRAVYQQVLAARQDAAPDGSSVSS
jgi:glycosyltransferase involved in cell wall biosynthesis